MGKKVYYQDNETKGKYVSFHDLPPNMQKDYYYPICNSEEIERIFNIQTGADYLLKLRADTIVDHMRLFRVYRNKALEAGASWSLEKSFIGYHFVNFLANLPDDLKEECDKVTFGNIFSNEPNGVIFKSNYGIITTLSDSLRYFIEFMNLGLGAFKSEIPQHVRINALKIAIRVMLQTEALDFKMDPRGIIPKNIQQNIYLTYPFQMQFLAGHEFSHYLLGHLKETNTSEQYLLKAMFNSQQDYQKIDSYTVSQKEEFDADVASINLPNYDLCEKRMIYESALLMFACFAVYETVHDYLYPPIGYQTHPNAMSRYNNLLEKVPKYSGFDSKYYEKDLPEIIQTYQRFFLNDIGYHIDYYEMYGSAYLDAPNSEWRGKELIDRVDYY